MDKRNKPWTATSSASAGQFVPLTRVTTSIGTHQTKPVRTGRSEASIGAENCENWFIGVTTYNTYRITMVRLTSLSTRRKSRPLPQIWPLVLPAMRVRTFLSSFGFIVNFDRTTRILWIDDCPNVAAALGSFA